MTEEPQGTIRKFDDVEDHLGEIAKKARKNPSQKNLNELQRVSEEGDKLLEEMLKKGENS